MKHDYFVHNLHTQRLFVYKNVPFVPLCMRSAVPVRLLTQTCKQQTPSCSYVSLSWAVVRLYQVLSLALKVTWLCTGHWGGNFGLWSRAFKSGCVCMSACAVPV